MSIESSELKRLFATGKYQKALERFNELQESKTIFKTAKNSFFALHLKIILKLTNRKEIDSFYFIDQLYNLKKSTLERNPKVEKSTFDCLNYNISLLKLNAGHLKDSENICKEIVSSSKNEMFLKSIYILLDIYFLCKSNEKIEYFLEKLKDKSLLTDLRKNKKIAEKSDFEDRAHLIWAFYYLSRFSVVTKNFDEAEKHLNQSFQIMKKLSNNKIADHNIKNVLKIQKIRISYFNGQYDDALDEIKQLLANFRKNGMTKMEGAIRNNFGCVLFKMDKKESAKKIFFNLLAKYNETALNDFKDSCCYDYSPIICFNIGTLFLKTQPVNAFRFFVEAANFFYNRPVLWLRMGQACLQYFKLKSEKNCFDEILKCCVDCYTIHKIYPRSGEPSAKKQKCKNCQIILKFKSEGLLRNSFGLSLQDSITYFEQSLILISKTNSLEWVKRDALLNLTAACYFSEDFVGAVHHAQKFLALKDIKETDRCLAALYSNESFCRLGKINEALKMLNPSKFANYDDFEREKALIYNNLACTYIVKGDLDRARICVDKALNFDGGLTSALRNLRFLKK